MDIIIFYLRIILMLISCGSMIAAVGMSFAKNEYSNNKIMRFSYGGIMAVYLGIYLVIK